MEKKGAERVTIVALVLPLIILLVWHCFIVQPYFKKVEEAANKTLELNETFLKEINRIDNIGTQIIWGPFVLTKEDMHSIKKILFSLKTEVDNAIKYSHADTINIVDRVNLYVTIAIVLLTLLGVFVPVIVQNFGKEELNQKIEELKGKIFDGEKGINELVTQSEENIKKSTTEKLIEMKQKIKNGEDEIVKLGESTSTKLKGLEDRIKDSGKKLKPLEDEVLNVPPLRLSYSLSRALDKDLIRWYTKNPKDNEKHLKNIFNSVLEDLRECKSKGILPGNNNVLSSSLTNFDIHLNDILLFQNGRRQLVPFENLQNCVSNLLRNRDSRKEVELFDGLIAAVNKIVNPAAVENTTTM